MLRDQSEGRTATVWHANLAKALFANCHALRRLPALLGNALISTVARELRHLFSTYASPSHLDLEM